MATQELLLRLQNPLAAVRVPAEGQFNEARVTAPHILVPELLGLAGAPTVEPATRQLAAILLRQCLSGSGSVYSSLPQNCASEVKQGLLQLVLADFAGVRRLATATVATLAAELLPVNQWPELPQALFAAISGQQVAEKVAGFEIIGALGEELTGVISPQHVQRLGEIYAASLAPSAEPQVQIAAGASLFDFAFTANKTRARVLSDLIPPALGVLSAALARGDGDGARKVLDAFCSVAEHAPSFLGKHQSLVLESMTTIAGNEAIDDIVRCEAVDFLVFFVESEPKAAEKMSGFVNSLTSALAQWVCAWPYDSIEEWAGLANDEDDVNTESQLHWFAKDGLDRIAQALKGRQVAATATRLAKDLVVSADWQQRFGGLTMLSQTADGCRKQYKKELPALIHCAVAAASDGHPLVRHAAIECLSQFCDDFAEHRPHFHDQVLSALMPRLADPIPRLRQFAAMAVVNLYDEAQAGLCSAAAPQLLPALRALCEDSSQPTFVQEQALLTVAQVLQNAGEACGALGADFLPLLSTITALPENRRHWRIQAAAVECLGLVVAAAPSAFGSEVNNILERLTTMHEAATSGDDPRVVELLTAWCRIAEAVGVAFTPVARRVLPAVLRSVTQTEKVATLGDEIEAPEGTEEVELPGGGRGAVLTGEMDEKTAACDAAGSIVEALGKELPVEAAQLLAEAIVPLIQSPYRKGIRLMAGELAANTVAALREREDPAALTLASQVAFQSVFRLAAAATEEDDPATLALLLGCLIEPLAVPNALDPTQVASLVSVLRGVVQDSLVRRGELDVEDEAEENGSDSESSEETESEDDDEEEDGTDAAAETRLIEAVATVMSEVIGKHPAAQPALLGDWLPFVRKLLLSGNAVCIRFALPALCDFVDHAGQAALPVLPDVASAFMSFAAHPDDAILQAAAFGIGLAAERSSGAPLPPAFYSGAADALRSVLTTGRSPSTTANIAAALVRIVDTSSTSVDAASILGQVAQGSPYSGDQEEADFVYTRLCHYSTSGVLAGQAANFRGGSAPTLSVVMAP
eukprot:Hpha_TRINITY_DN13298_c0_g1::TRINITY_DN13298_c0_g1_i1::g.154513::m.154513/K20222/IPO5, KPNB3, RANBP5; importin-5